jgi:hypothetical protein
MWHTSSNPPTRAISGAVGMGESLDCEGTVIASAIAAMGSGLGLYLMASVLTDAGDITSGQILVAVFATGGIHHN